REDRSGCAEFRTHVGDDMTVHRRQAIEAGSVIFDDPANAAFYTVASEHFQYHVFGTDPVRHLSCQLHAHHTRHFHMVCFPCHRHRDIDAAGAHRKHAHAAVCTCMTVGAEKCLARNRQLLHMHRMAHAVARPAVMHPEFPGGAPQEYVVVRVTVIVLDQVVIHVLCRNLRSHPVHIHRLEPEHHHRPGRGSSPRARASPACRWRAASASGRSCARFPHRGSSLLTTDVPVSISELHSTAFSFPLSMKFIPLPGHCYTYYFTLSAASNWI